MKKFRKLLAAMMVFVMVLGLAACGDKPEETKTEGEETSTPAPEQKTELSVKSGRNEEITIGTWWVQYYDSSDTVLEDDPTFEASTTILDTDTPDKIKTKEVSKKIAQLKLDNVRRIEEKYGRKFYWENLTYAGVKESIEVSILAGAPDCDVYLCETSFAIPAQMNGLALDLKTVLPADADIFTTQENAAYLDLGDGKACIFYKKEAQKTVEATYPLGFNIQMLEENNLEDPRELYARNEWTWDKFIEYCKVLTKDTDGDGQIDQYGYCGFAYETFEQLMMSNGTYIAINNKENLTSKEVGEALKMMSDMYNLENVCYPYDYDGDPSSSMRGQYRQGNIGFFPIAAWITADQADYDYNGQNGVTLPFDIAYVRWPVGPSGDKETNAGKNLSSGEFYIIPASVQEPEVVFNIINDMWNWYQGDTSIRDDRETLNWWYKVTAKDEDLQELNFKVMEDCGNHSEFDLWQSLNIFMDFPGLMKGEITPAQMQETYKQQYQEALDVYFGN